MRPGAANRNENKIAAASWGQIDERIRGLKGGMQMTMIDTLKSQFRQGKVSRRSFMEGALALGMTVAGASAYVK